jgi:hypothetical protein
VREAVVRYAEGMETLSRQMAVHNVRSQSQTYGAATASPPAREAKADMSGAAE